MKMTKQSGGPRSAAGKAVAKRNALKTGSYSSVMVLPGEDESEFQQLKDQFISDFAPQDIAEMAMVQELAGVVWKKLRLEKLEQSAALKVLNAPITMADYQQHSFEIRKSATWLFNQLERLTKQQVKRHRDLLEATEPYADKDVFANEAEAMAVMDTDLYQHLLQQAKAGGFIADIEPTPSAFAAIEILNEFKEVVSLVRHLIKALRIEARDVIWVDANKDKLIEIQAAIKERRLLGVMQLDGPRRVHDDLSRIFFRTLAELRKHQNWRLEKNTVDITPKPPAKT